MRDSLFILHSGFHDPSLGSDAYYCVECAAIEGLLTRYPALAERIDVHRIGFERPRQSLIDLLGSAHQNCPTLVVGAPAGPRAFGLQVSAATGRYFVSGIFPVGEYLARAYRLPRPHP